MQSARDKGTEAARSIGLRLAVFYAIAAFGWIIVTDAILFLWGPSPQVLATLSSAKGVAFVLFTAAALYMLAVGYLRRIHVSEERHRRLFEHATEGLMIFRVLRAEDLTVRDIELEDMNPIHAARLGVSRNRMIGATLKSPRPDETVLSDYFELLIAALEEGQPISREVQRDGRFEMLATYATDEDVWVVASMDVTELRRVEFELAAQEARIRQAYVDVLDAVTGGKLVLLTDAELEQELGEPLTAELLIDSPAQLAEARRRISQSLEPMSPESDSYDLMGPVGEALTNALKHAGAGTYQVFRKGEVAQVAITDLGPGIDFKTLPKAALQTGFSTTATLGMGFTIMMQLAERVLLNTRPGRTSVVLESRLGGGEVRRPEPASAGDRQQPTPAEEALTT